jgi:hypothetical protein
MRPKLARQVLLLTSRDSHTRTVPQASMYVCLF